MMVEWESQIIRRIVGYGGRAKFINGKLFDLDWSPDGDLNALTLSSASIYKFSELMRFLRAVEKVQLEVEYGARMVANDGLQLWIEKPEKTDEFESIVAWFSEVYDERYGMKPNILVVSEDETADTSFWKGKVLRVPYLLPIHFRLSYQVQDAEEETERD